VFPRGVGSGLGEEELRRAWGAARPDTGQNLASLPATVEQATCNVSETAVRWLVASIAERHPGKFLQAGVSHSLATAADDFLPGRLHLARKTVAVETQRPLGRVTHF